MSGSRKSVRNKLSLMAHNDLDRLGANPIEMLVEVYREAMKSYRDLRGVTDKGDPGAHYLSVAGKAAVDLAKFKHPTLSAIAVKDMTESESDKKPLTTTEAIEVIKADPFAPKDLKEIPTERIVEAMNTPLNAPFLPSGDKKLTQS